MPALIRTPPSRLYSAKLAQYRKRMWTCAATQAGELTFEEALASEAAGEKLAPEARCCANLTACLYFRAHSLAEKLWQGQAVAVRACLGHALSLCKAASLRMRCGACYVPVSPW